LPSSWTAQDSIPRHRQGSGGVAASCSPSTAPSLRRPPMRPHTRWVAVASGWGVLLFAAGMTRAVAQESHIGSVTGHAPAGRPLYERYCAGCHGDDGDARGENAQGIDPRPRDFTMAVFKCRSTPTGTLPTDEDLLNAMTRGFVTTNLPPWVALTPQGRADMVAYIKT